jgi:hypothetical protein
MNHLEQYRCAVISNIRYGHGFGRNHTLYAEIRGTNDELLVSATLEYCTARMVEAAKYFAKVDRVVPLSRAITVDSLIRTIAGIECPDRRDDTYFP